MANEPIVITKQYKDHTVKNPVNDLSDLPFNAHSVHTQLTRELNVTIQVLDEKTGSVLETLNGVSTSGSLKAESDSLIRRTGSLTMIATDDTFPKADSLIWFGKIVKVYLGLLDASRNNEEINFLIGTYWIDDSDYTVDSSSQEISINLSDKMTKWSDQQLEAKLKLPINTPINEAMRLVMENIGETSFGKIATVSEDEVVPYTMEYNVGDEVTKVITDLRDMYMDYVCGYNVNGEFEFTKVEVQKDDETAEPKWSFVPNNSKKQDLSISFRESYSLKNIKNRIIVYGGTSDITGITPIGESRITDVKSPFNIYSIGERKKIIKEDKYVTNDQCIAKAKYEVLKASNFQEVCNISCAPIYIIDTNDIIEVYHPYTHEKMLYLVDSFDYGIGVDSTMNITAHKLYFISLEYGKDKNPLVDAVVRGIQNWGWISLGEERIRDAYNIMGSGKATLTVRFQDVISGGEQASVTSYPTTKNQTMMIDLADLVGLDLSNENGHVEGRSKGDYLDRVLGLHEMFHAVTNDYLGHDFMVQTPVWFKEGFAEFTHGARERFGSVYREQSKEDKKKSIIDLASSLLDNNWTGKSEDYVASYLIAIAIYKKCDESMWRNLFIRLKQQTSPGINFLYKLLPIADTNTEVKIKVIQEMKDMNDVWDFLFDNNDIDTGSVGGIHFMNLYGIPLTAESVANNANATVNSIGFELKIEK